MVCCQAETLEEIVKGRSDLAKALVRASEPKAPKPKALARPSED